MLVSSCYSLGKVVRFPNGIVVYTVGGKIMSSSFPLSPELRLTMEQTIQLGTSVGHLGSREMESSLQFPYDEDDDDDADTIGTEDTWSLSDED